ncbi:basic leucine zipper 4 [Punica granatum]|uniref:BZIP domain-containing protein n=2 Tax=Punica granatum TaxID=22663 RepID=A0A218W098_PUNGR|nr:basic leucine zipper 4 [Punica granatum]OWM65691.1 hypothetical protein CDL15_Pgr017188 [Punica granatum]PKI71340.1 hypothetical protein CRG98_008340 [Punica granatum]
MLSTYPAVTLPDSTPGSPFPSFETRFAPWICSDIHSGPILQSPEPIVSSPLSPDSQNPRPASHCTSDSSDRPNRSKKPVVDERKRRRMASNRESARRSRMRKQQHHDNLRNEVNRLRILNRELTSRLQVISHQSHLLQTENDQLYAEHTFLRLNLLEMKNVVQARQLPQSSSTWPCNNVTPFAPEQLIAPLVTELI